MHCEVQYNSNVRNEKARLEKELFVYSQSKTGDYLGTVTAMMTYEENILRRILETCIETDNPAQCVSVDGPNFLKTDKNK